MIKVSNRLWIIKIVFGESVVRLIGPLRKYVCAGICQAGLPQVGNLQGSKAVKTHRQQVKKVYRF